MEFSSIKNHARPLQHKVLLHEAGLLLGTRISHPFRSVFLRLRKKPEVRSPSYIAWFRLLLSIFNFQYSEKHNILSILRFDNTYRPIRELCSGADTVCSKHCVESSSFSLLPRKPHLKFGNDPVHPMTFRKVIRPYFH